VSIGELRERSQKSQAATNQLSWKTGAVYGQAQNFARRIVEMPANLATPTLLANLITKEFEGLKNVEIRVRDKRWIQEREMRSFLSVAAGSVEEPKFVEIVYKGAGGDAKPVALVGKGMDRCLTFYFYFYFFLFFSRYRVPKFKRPRQVVLIIISFA
jgi:leucyl aminopeptidase